MSFLGVSCILSNTLSALSNFLAYNLKFAIFVFSDKNCNWILSTQKPKIANINSRFQNFFMFVMSNEIYQSIPGDIF